MAFRLDNLCRSQQQRQRAAFTATCGAHCPLMPFSSTSDDSVKTCNGIYCTCWRVTQNQSTHLDHSSADPELNTLPIQHCFQQQFRTTSTTTSHKMRLIAFILVAFAAVFTSVMAGNSHDANDGCFAVCEAVKGAPKDAMKTSAIGCPGLTGDVCKRACSW